MEVRVNQHGEVISLNGPSHGYVYSVTVCPNNHYLMLIRFPHVPSIAGDKQVCLYYGLGYHWKKEEILQTISAKEGFIPEHADLLQRILEWAMIDLMRIAYKHESPPKVGYQI